MNKAAHVTRMENEFLELSEKMKALDSFVLGSEIFRGLPNIDQQLLLAQYSAMKTYAQILSMRIERSEES